MRNFKEKILVVFLGTIAVLILLEISLRIIGTVYRGKAEMADSQSSPRGAYVILCLGNSFTYGLGAPKAESYPAQLQRLFDARHQDKGIVVVNRGMIACNSAEVLSGLRRDLDRVKPQLVILQTGSPNLWNPVRYEEYLKRKNINATVHERLRYFFNDCLHQLRVYKLASLLYLNAKNCFIAQGKDSKTAAGNIAYRNSADYRQAAALSEDLLFNFFNKSGLSGADSRNPAPDKSNPRDIGQAVSTLKEAVRADPYYPRNYRYLGDIFLSQGRFDEALEWYTKGIMVSPDSGDNDNYDHIKILYSVPGKDINKKLVEFIAGFRRTNPAAAKKMFNLSKREALDWVESDVIEMVKICRQKNVAVVLEGYPPFVKDVVSYWKDYIDALNERLRKSARGLGIPFVDNEEAFAGLLREEERGSYFNDEFLIYGHCNSKGYKVIAENSYRVILESRILK